MTNKHLKAFVATLGLALLVPLMAGGDTTRIPAQGIAGLTVGTTPISGGATTQVLFNLGGFVSSDSDMTFATDTLTVTKLSTGGAPTAANAVSVQETAGCITFEGATSDALQSRLCATDPTGAGDQTFNLPNFGGNFTVTLAALERPQTFTQTQTSATGTGWALVSASAGLNMAGRAAGTPDAVRFETGTTANAIQVALASASGTDLSNGRCLISACTNPGLEIFSADSVAAEYLHLQADQTGAAHVQSNFAEIVVGGFKNNITEASAQVIVRITMPSAGMFSGYITYLISDSDGTDHVARGGTTQIQGANKAGTSVCTINTGRDQETEDGSQVANAAAAFTLTYTWTNVVNTTSCDLSLNAASSAGANTYDIVYTVHLNGNSNAITVNPQ